MLKKFYTSDFGKIITGNTPSTQVNEYWNGEYCWITPSDLKDNKYYFKSDRQLTIRGLSKARVLPPNTLLVTCIASIGKNGILTVNGACNQQINAIIPNKNFNVDYLYYLFNFNKNYMLANAGITATPLISKKEFEKFQFIAENDISVQEEISYCLSDIDLLIVNLKNLIKKKKFIKQGVMQELLTGKKHLPGFNKEWSLESNIFKFVKGKQVSHQELDGFGKYKMYNGGISFSGLYPDYNYEDKIIISEGGNSCGFVNYIKTKFWAGGHCYVIISCDLDKEFLYQLLKFNQNKIMSLRVGSGLPNIQAKNLSKMNFYFPTSKQEQIEIGKILTDMDEEINSLEQDLEKYKNIKQGMMEQLLTGKIRVV